MGGMRNLEGRRIRWGMRVDLILRIRVGFIIRFFPNGRFSFMSKRLQFSVLAQKIISPLINKPIFFHLILFPNFL